MHGNKMTLHQHRVVMEWKMNRYPREMNISIENNWQHVSKTYIEFDLEEERGRCVEEREGIA